MGSGGGGSDSCVDSCAQEIWGSDSCAGDYGASCFCFFCGGGVLVRRILEGGILGQYLLVRCWGSGSRVDSCELHFGPI